MAAESDIAQLPEGLWIQPAVDLSAIPELEGVDQVQRVRMHAAIKYDFVPGVATTRFLHGLKQKKLLGERAEGSDDVYIPPRGMNPTTGKPTIEQVELPHKGTVTTFCVVHIGFGVNAPPTPFCSALVLIDGACVSVYGPIQEIEYDKVRIGMRVEPVWVDDDQLDTSFENIKYWRPIDEPDVDAALLKGHM